MNQNIILDQLDYTYGKDCPQHNTKDMSQHSRAGRPQAEHEGTQKTMVAQSKTIQGTDKDRGQNSGLSTQGYCLGWDY